MMRVGVLGHDAYAPHIADALRRQPDIEFVGFYHQKPTFLSRELSFMADVYCSESNFDSFKEKGIKVSGFLEEFLENLEFLLEYNPIDLSFKLSFKGTGIELGPKEVTIYRFSESLPVEDASIRWVSDSLYCCPFFRAAILELSFSREIKRDFLINSLLSARRVFSINEEVNLNDFCIYYATYKPQTLFSIILFLRSVQLLPSGKSINVFSLYGILSVLPEVIDAMRESRGMDREVSSSITDHHLSIKSGLLS